MKDDKVIDLQQVKNDRGEHDLELTIETLRQRVRELLAINGTHKELVGKLIVENEELKKNNKALAKQIDDYLMLVKDLQQFLGSFTDKLKDGKGRGNAVQHARIYIEVDGYLEEIKRMEVQENNIIGVQQGLRLVLKPMKSKKLILPPGVMGDY